jgi:hypothetical protein
MSACCVGKCVVLTFTSICHHYHHYPPPPTTTTTTTTTKIRILCLIAHRYSEITPDARDKVLQKISRLKCNKGTEQVYDYESPAQQGLKVFAAIIIAYFLVLACILLYHYDHPAVTGSSTWVMVLCALGTCPPALCPSHLQTLSTQPLS